MKVITKEEVHIRTVECFGLDACALDLTATEAIAAALRRAAGFLCPCSAQSLVRAVLHPLVGLVEDYEASRIQIEETLEAMVAHGDLFEQRDVCNEGGQTHRVLLYLAPPSFVPRKSGAAIILGIAPDNQSPLSEEIEARVEYSDYVRLIPSTPCGDTRAELSRFGLIELGYDDWLKMPRQETHGQYLARLDQLLSSRPYSGEIPELEILDPTKPVRYYKGRWDIPRRRSGRFIGRRPQAYGAPYWCYVQLNDGRPERFIDLPLDPSSARGCDEAWRVQLAIDAECGHPQQFRIIPGHCGTRIFELFSPLPLWARRRWNAVGTPVPLKGCLFAYQFHKDECPEEIRFTLESLWLSECPNK